MEIQKKKKKSQKKKYDKFCLHEADDREANLQYSIADSENLEIVPSTLKKKKKKKISCKDLEPNIIPIIEIVPSSLKKKKKKVWCKDLEPNIIPTIDTTENELSQKVFLRNDSAKKKKKCVVDSELHSYVSSEKCVQRKEESWNNYKNSNVEEQKVKSKKMKKKSKKVSFDAEHNSSDTTNDLSKRQLIHKTEYHPTQIVEKRKRDENFDYTKLTVEHTHHNSSKTNLNFGTMNLDSEELKTKDMLPKKHKKLNIMNDHNSSRKKKRDVRIDMQHSYMDDKEGNTSRNDQYDEGISSDHNHINNEVAPEKNKKWRKEMAHTNFFHTSHIDKEYAKLNKTFMKKKCTSSMISSFLDKENNTSGEEDEEIDQASKISESPNSCASIMHKSSFTSDQKQVVKKQMASFPPIFSDHSSQLAYESLNFSALKYSFAELALNSTSQEVFLYDKAKSSNLKKSHSVASIKPHVSALEKLREHEYSSPVVDFNKPFSPKNTKDNDQSVQDAYSVNSLDKHGNPPVIHLSPEESLLVVDNQMHLLKDTSSDISYITFKLPDGVDIEDFNEISIMPAFHSEKDFLPDQCSSYLVDLVEVERPTLCINFQPKT